MNIMVAQEPEPERAKTVRSQTEEATSALTEEFMRFLDYPLLSSSLDSANFGDVVVMVQRLGDQLRFLRAIKEQVPCLTINPDQSPVPLDLVPTMRDTLQALGRTVAGAWYRLYAKGEWLRQFRGFEGEPNIRDYDEGSVRAFFRDRLHRFLVGRVQGLGSEFPHSPGLRIRVETKSSGLRVHYSEACFFNPRKVLSGELTTPVIGWLPPSWYLFGLSASGQPPKFDLDREYEIPPCDLVEFPI